eukprot:gene312-523_t
MPYACLKDQEDFEFRYLSPSEQRRVSLGSWDEGPQVPEELLSKQPGQDGSVARQRIAKRSYTMDDEVDKEDLCSYLLNVLLLKAQNPGLGWSGVEGVLDLTGAIKSLDESFKKSIPDNYRALMTALSEHFHFKLSVDKDDLVCPKCQQPRFETLKNGKKKARLQLVLRSLADFIERVYKHPELAKWAHYHADNVSRSNDVCDFQDGKAYQQAMQDERFRNDARNLLMALITDGVQPHKDDSKYSMWPLAATFYNWPPWLRYQLGVTTLLGVIPGSTLPMSALDLQPVLEIITDQLELLSKHGVQVWDAHKGEMFTCYVKLVQAISDIRGIEKILKFPSTPAVFACFFCWLRGLRACNKTVYLGHHVMLPTNHPLRATLAALLEKHAAHCPGCKSRRCPGQHAKAADSVAAPSARTHEQLKLGNRAAAGNMRAGTGGDLGGAEDAHQEEGLGFGDDDSDNSDEDEEGIEDDVTAAAGERQVPTLFQLPDFNALLHVGYDGMHTIGGVILDTMLKCIQSLRFKAAVRSHEDEIGRFDQQPWQASPDDLSALATALSDIVAATDSCVTGSRFTRLLSPGKKNKSHQSFVLASPLGQHCLAAMQDLGMEQRAALNQLLHACNCLQRKHFTAAELQELQGEVLLAVCMVEAYLPVNEMDIKLHVLLHLADKIQNSGPLWTTSMFPYEGMWSKLVDWATNPGRPELSLLRNFCDYELASFAYWQAPDSFSVPAVKAFTEEYAKEIAVRYQVPCSPDIAAAVGITLGSAKLTSCSAVVDVKLRLAIHLYYNDFNSTYRKMFLEFLNSWFNSLTRTQRQALSIVRLPSGELSYKLKALHQALIQWHGWAVQQMKALTAAVANAAAQPGPTGVMQLKSQQQQMAVQLCWSKSITCLVAARFTEAVVNGKRVVCSNHSRAAEFSWVLLKRWDEDIGHMCFMHVFDIVGHTDGNGDKHIMLYGELHSSKAAHGGIDVDPFVGLPVMSVKADKEHHTTCACIAAEVVASTDISVVSHSSRQGMLQVLVRSPAALFLPAGYALPIRF